MPPPPADQPASEPGPLAYARSRFRTRLPRDRHYTESHCWLMDDPDEPGVVRVGFTRFATRMLGEIVEMDFEVKGGDAVEVGQTIGWFEGFKAVSDLFSPIAGTFVSAHPKLQEVSELVHMQPYGDHWLYRIRLGAAGLPEGALPAEGYAGFLDQTIDRMMGGS